MPVSNELTLEQADTIINEAFELDKGNKFHNFLQKAYLGDVYDILKENLKKKKVKLKQATSSANGYGQSFYKKIELNNFDEDYGFGNVEFYFAVPVDTKYKHIFFVIDVIGNDVFKTKIGY